MPNKLISSPKRAIGAAAILLLASTSVYAADSAGSAHGTGATAAGAAATSNMNAGQVNNRAVYTVTSPAPGTAVITPGAPQSPPAPGTPAPPPNQIVPYPPNVPLAQPAGQH